MKNLILYLVLFAAAVLRFTSLNVYPYGFTPDEASFGYDAYSIMQTGKDQWGNSFPLVLKSFGDYKPPLYSYLSIPFIGVFGLNSTAIRMTNAFFGTVAVFVTYLLAGELGSLTGFSKKSGHRLQLISAGLLAVSPWHVMMSRGAFEANLTTFFLPLGLYLFLRSFKKERLLSLAALTFGLNLFTYHSARLVTPLFLGLLVLMFKDRLRDLAKGTKITSISVFAVFLFLALYTISLGGAQRAKDLSIFGGAAQEAAEDRLTALENGVPFVIAKSFHNKYTIAAERFVENYVQYTSYKFLFTDGPAEETYGMMPGTGVTYWFTLPFMLFFLFYFFKDPSDKSAWIIISWLLLAPIAAALTTGPGYAGNRAVVMLPGLQLMIAYGAIKLLGAISSLDQGFLYRVFKSAYLLVIVVSVSFFLEKYFVLSPSKVADGMLFGRLEAARVVDDFFEPQEEIVFSTSLSEPHIYVAFARKIDPTIYQSHSRDWDLSRHNVDWVDQLPEYRIGKYVFKKVSWNNDSAVYSNFVGLPEEFPENIEESFIIASPNHEPAVIMINSDIESYAYKVNK